MLNMSEADWKFLLGRIKAGKCTPFLGAGASAGTFPLGSEIAKQWAKEYDYPLKDTLDLARVAQYVAVTIDSVYLKNKIQELFQALPLPDFTAPDEPYRLLADLPFPIYMTTNYDNSMASALTMQHRDPRLEVCRWNTYLRDNVKAYLEEDQDYIPSAANPLVYHLHGNLKTSESLVLTEDDYLDFLGSISDYADLLPMSIRQAMFGSSLLFLGYQMADWNFRVLFRSFAGKSLARSHMAVMTVPEHKGISKVQQEKWQKYLEHYYARLEIRIYWGSCREFATELRRRWLEYTNGI